MTLCRLRARRTAPSCSGQHWNGNIDIAAPSELGTKGEGRQPACVAVGTAAPVFGKRRQGPGAAHPEGHVVGAYAGPGRAACMSMRACRMPAVARDCVRAGAIS